MDKKALLEYALFARKELETQIALSLNKIGIYSDHVSYAHIVGDRTIIEGISESFDKRVYDLRKRIADECLKDQKFETLVEEFAYTWFNRIIAIRFMEVHDYFPHGFRVLTSRDGSYEPEILKNLPYVLDELQLDSDVIQSLKEQNKIEELYRYVLIKQCNALNPIFPELFDKQESYLEYLLPNNLLGQDSVIKKIDIIPPEDFLNDVEVVGWLYQFYNSVKKDEVFASKETITKDTLPAVTQLFTPDWIVRYMADNSVGRLWLESNSNSSLKSKLKYYVEDGEQDEETIRKLNQIKYKNVNPEEIKIIEPCCGSGHILVYVFDILYNIYLEKGYNSKDIPSLILKNNLFGLDVDKRAAQLAQFSLVMKARSFDNRFFIKNRFVMPQVYEILDSQLLVKTNFLQSMESLHFSRESIELTKYLVDSFLNGKVIGSLLILENKDYSKLTCDIDRCLLNESPGLYDQEFYHIGIPHIKKLICIAQTLSQKYDVMITNPPYISISSLEPACKEYAISKYPDSKTDMFAMFMETHFVKNNGYLAMINMHSWMFLNSFDTLRKKLVNGVDIISLIHLGPHAFDTIGGEVVQTVSFVLRKTKTNFNGSFYRLVDYPSSVEKEQHFLLKQNLFLRKTETFNGFPTQQIVYWAPSYITSIFQNNENIGSYSTPKSGIMTGKDDIFVHYWFEVPLQSSSLFENNLTKIQEGKITWFPLTRGGQFRKWYGNLDSVINMRSSGFDITHLKNNNYRLRDPNYYFKECGTWTMISSNSLSVRFVPNNILYGNGGPTIFPRDHLPYIIALLNSKVANYFTKMLNPTINTIIDDIVSIPLIFDDVQSIEENSMKCIDISKEDWDSIETSWNFKKHPFLKYGKGKLENFEEQYSQELLDNIEKIKAYEIINNTHFINLYGLSDVLSAEVDDSQITLRRPDKTRDIRELISYLIGLLMGRYSLKKDGLIEASRFENFDDFTDDDGIVPIYKFIGIESGLTSKICEFVKLIFGDTYYKENLDFIAECLGRKSEEGPQDTINRYLNEDFYSDHLKAYQKRPIYWMFSSGKTGAFKAIVYMHRYSKNTLAKLNSMYFLPRTAMYKSEKERLEFQLKSSTDSKQSKMLEKQIIEIEKSEVELLEYGQILDHLSNQYIEIDLNDGVKKNYCKFQGTTLEINGATIKKDLLVAFGLEKK